MQELAHSLHEKDFYAWTQDQAGKLRALAQGEVPPAIDWELLAEEIDSVGRAEQREALFKCGTIALHLMKWRVLTGSRSGSVECLIKIERLELQRFLSESPSLLPLLTEDLAWEYELSRLRFVAETGLPLETNSSDCPFTIEQILDLDFYPKAPT